MSEIRLPLTGIQKILRPKLTIEYWIQTEYAGTN
jgi:hypothetical protein